MQYSKYMLMGFSVFTASTLTAQENTYVAPGGNVMTHSGANVAIFGNLINDARGTAASAVTSQSGFNHNGGGTVYLYRHAANGTGNSRIYDGADNSFYGTGSDDYNAGGKAVRFYNLITDNNVGTASPSGTGVNSTSGSGHVQFEQEVSVSNQLTFNNGIIWTPRGDWKHAYLHFDADGASYTGAGPMNSEFSGTSTNMQVDGYVAKTGSSAFTFPIGDGVYMRRSGLVAPANGIYRSAYFKSNANSLNSGSGISGSATQGPTSNMNGGIAKINTTEFWDIDGTAQSQFSLDAFNSVAGYSNWSVDFSAVQDVTASKIVITALDDWENLSIAVAPGSYSDNGTMTTGFATTPDVGGATAPATGRPFVAYTWAVAPVSTPLSLQLLSFDGKASGCDAVLTWETANEVNFNHFEIEYSAKGQDFETLGRLKGGNSSYTYSYGQASSSGFYKLKMVDQDGTYEYSGVVKVTTSCDKSVIEVYPNPANNQVNIKGASTGASIYLVNALGQTMLSTQSTGKTINHLNVSHLAAGSYTILIIEGGGRTAVKLVKSE